MYGEGCSQRKSHHRPCVFGTPHLHTDRIAREHTRPDRAARQECDWSLLLPIGLGIFQRDQTVVEAQIERQEVDGTAA